jgi:MFS family permease
MNGVNTRANDIDGESARNIGVLVMFTALTNLADGVTKVALPLMATMLTASPALVAGVSVTLTLPWLLVALHVGVLVDRADRRVLLWIADITRLLVIAGLLSLVLIKGVTLSWLYVGGLTLGIAEVVAQTSASALIPDAVAPPGRERANAWMTGAETVCNEFCGPLVGGILVAGSTAVALSVVFGGYIAGVLILLLLVGNFRVKPVRNAPQASVHEQIVEGLKCLWEEKLLRLMALSLSVLCACWGAWLALMPMFATTAMGLDAKGYGIMLSALGVGGLVGAVSTTTLNRLFGRRNVMLADLVGTFAMVATPVITTNLWAVSAGAFIGGLGGTLWTVNSRTISQRLVPNSMLGRYSAASRLFSWGAMPIGAALVGLLAEFFGIRVAFSVFAICTALLIIPFIKVVTPSRLDAVGT